MADLEAVLADVSYLMAMEKSKCTPAARASKKIVLPDPRYVYGDVWPAGIGLPIIGQAQRHPFGDMYLGPIILLLL